MSISPDIIIIGAGPAGMAAASMAAQHGASTLILDEQNSPGGQIYRAIERAENQNRAELGVAYHEGLSQAKALRASGASYVSQASVWQVSPDLEVGYSANGKAHLVTAKQIILAGGAVERPMPVLGWTLPGVMTAGAAQVLLKESGIAIQDGVFAGTGPLLYLIVHQYMMAGIPVKAVIDLTPKANYLMAAPYLPKAILSVSKILDGWRWQRQIARSDIEFVRGAIDIRICGKAEVEAIEYLKGGKWHRIECQNVLLHQGVLPNLNMALASGCAKVWNERQMGWNISVDDWFCSSIKGIAIAGDGAAIGGGIAAKNQGAIAAIGALQRLGEIDTQTQAHLAKPYRKSLRREMAARPFLEALFRPIDTMRIPQKPEIIVCRCEEITAGDIRTLVAKGHNSPNQLKSQSRCGMGPCQGRFCGLTVTEMLATLNQVTPEQTGYFRLRAPLKPLSLAELATLAPQVKD